MNTRLLLFEDNNDLRHSLKTLLNSVEGYEVVGDFDNCEQAASLTLQLLPDVVIMDIDLPKINGIEGLRVIKEQRPETAIIMHTVFEDDQRLFESLCAGASGYILKNSSIILLLQAVEDVQHGGAPMSPSIARRVLQSFQQRTTAKNKYGLSEREQEVLKYLTKGYSYKMIAAACFISLSTVQAHIKNIYTKLHVNCGREAVVKALSEMIV
jgi:DNA-binding NarL/FixJ family response regulator